ncbi:hypothetical protein Gpo141_00009635 [Globisporangium polare]
MLQAAAAKTQSMRSIFRVDATSFGASSQSVKSDDLRNGGRARTESRQISWVSTFRGLRRPTQQHIMISQTIQKWSYHNSDTPVAALEVAIFVLSMIQLELSSNSPRWKQGDAKRHPEAAPSHPVIMPYPGLEEFVPRDQAKVLVLLSAAVVVRTVFWRVLLFFPYPIHQKGKVACFTDNLEFTYHEFVLKKVFDDDPLKKILMIYTILLAMVAYLLHVVESVHGACYWKSGLGVVGIDSDGAEDLVCSTLAIQDAFWLTVTTFLGTGYGDVVPKSYGGRFLVAVSGCLIKFVSALLFSIIIKQNKFATMEARVHSFLFRMELNAKKDLIAVMAVQATFRFNKSYKQSLIWHQQDHSNLYFRPLSARLPNEVKKKLYVSRFQASLKEIMKYNTDGDLLNAFTKHIEVITAALGVTFVEMTNLKKLYYRKNRILEDRRRRAKQGSSSQTRSLTGGDAYGGGDQSFDGGREVVSGMRSLGIAASVRTFTSSSTAAMSARDGSQATVVASANHHASSSQLLKSRCNSFHSNQWQTDMMRKCDETLALLQKIQTTAQTIR